MNKYVQSFRLRTLPLSMSGIILGSGVAYPLIDNQVTFWGIFSLAILTTLSLQILSNLSNEVGDAQHGTDDGQQNREAYGLQNGSITLHEMKIMIGIFIGLSIVFGTSLIWVSFGTLFCTESVIFLLLGLFAIVGAMTYTLGKHNYGYIGLGDLGVFIFFGLLSTIGSYYLQTHNITTEIIWCSVAIALPIVGVLNLNNIRDMDNDKLHGKRTFAGLLGKTGGKIYHTILVLGCLLIFTLIKHYYVLILLPVIIWHLVDIWRLKDGQLDRQMPVLMFTTIGIAILACF